MPSSRLAFRIDLALILGFVAICAYARRVDLELRAPLESGPRIGKAYTGLSQVDPVPIVAATRPQSGQSKLEPPRATSTPGGGSAGSTVAFSPNGASDVISAPLPEQVQIQQSCANAGSGSSCPTALAEANAPSGTLAPSQTIVPAASVMGAKVSVSDEEGSSSDPFTPTGVGGLSIMPLYADMLGAPVRSAGASPSGGETYEPDASGDGFTPTYPWEAQLLMPFVGNPSPFYILPPVVWLPDIPKKDDPKKDGDVGGFDRDLSGNKLGTNQPPVTATPEPATLTMLATGFVALGTLGRRRKRIAAA